MLRLSFLLPLIALAPACVTLDDVIDPPPTGGLQTADLGGMSNVTVCGNVWMGCEADAKDIGIAGRRGIRTVIDLRTNTDVDIRSCAEKEGLEYLRLEFDASRPDPDAVDLALETMLEADREGQSILMLCDSGARSAIVFAVHRVIQEGVELEVALEEARRAGMKPDSELVVRQQVRRLIGT